MSNTAESDTMNATSGLRHRRPRQRTHEGPEVPNDLSSSLTTSEWRVTVADVHDALREVNAPKDTLEFTEEQIASDISKGVEEIASTMKTVSLNEDGYIFSRSEVDEVGGWLTKLVSYVPAPAQPNKIGPNINTFAAFVRIAKRSVLFSVFSLH